MILQCKSCDKEPSITFYKHKSHGRIKERMLIVCKGCDTRIDDFIQFSPQNQWNKINEGAKACDWAPGSYRPIPNCKVVSA